VAPLAAAVAGPGGLQQEGGSEPRHRRRAGPVAAAPAPAPGRAQKLKVAFAYVGPVGDGGWTFAHDNARKAVQKEFGDKIETTFVEKVPESPTPSA
jgi:basic membrane protein A